MKETEISLAELLATQEEPSPMKEVTRGQFMTQLNNILDAWVRTYEGHTDKATEAERMVMGLLRTRAKVEELEKNGYRVTYLLNDEGDLSFEARPKGDAGFLAYRSKNA